MRTRLITLVVFMTVLTFVPSASVAADGPLTIDVDTTLTVDHYGPIEIVADNVTLACAGDVHVIGDGWGDGISLDGRTGATVRDCDVSGFQNGIVLRGSTSNSILGNHVHDNVEVDGFSVGIGLWDSPANSIDQNTVVDNDGHGVATYGASDGNALTGNSSESNGQGFWIRTDGNTLQSNAAIGNGGGGFWLAGFADDEVVGNVLIDNLSLENGFKGFRLGFASGSLLQGNIADGNSERGFGLTNSHDNHLESNWASIGDWGAFVLSDDSYSNTLIGNTAEGDGEIGFGLDSSDFNILEGNTSIGGSIGFSVHALSTGNELTGNSVSRAWIGIDIFRASTNRVVANTVSEGGFGIKLDAAQGNTLSRNSVTGMGDAGIALIQVPERAATTANEVTRNTVADSNTGFAVWGAEGNSFVRNRADSPWEMGFSLEGAHGNEFRRNSVTHTSSGFRVNESDGNLLSHNTSFGGDDFILSDSHHNRLVSNTATGDPSRDVYYGTDGFILFASSGNELSGNTAESQGGEGFRLDDGSRANHLDRNLSVDNGHSGIALGGSDDNVIDRNHVFGNGTAGEDSAGIYVRNSAGNEITRNVACDNSLHDATQAASPTTIWERNDFCEALYFHAPIYVSVSSGSVWGHGFTPDTDATVEIDRGTTNLFSGPAGVNEFGDFWVETGVTPEPSDVVTVSDGTITRQLVVAHLTFDLYDVDADVMAGTAAPGTDVRVGYGNEFEGYDTIVTADTSGNWYLDVTDHFDLTYDTGVDAAIFEDDGDATIAWPPPPPQIRANPQHDWVGGFGFGQDSTVSILIADGLTTLYDGSAPVTDGEFDVNAGFDLQPGHVVTVTGNDSGIVKTLDVATLTFDVYDIDNDVMEGTADPGTEVRVNYGNEFEGFEVYVTTDGSGTWTVNLSGEFDLTYDTWAEAAIDDDDRDHTYAWKPEPPQQPVIRVAVSSGSVWGHGFTAGETVAVTLDGFLGSELVNEFGDFWVETGITAVPGQVVTVTGDDSGIVKTLDVASLTFDVYDVDTDVMAGTADPGTEVRVNYGNESEGFEVYVTADASGSWTINLSGEFDLTYTTLLSGADASVYDDDGDATFAWPPPPPQIRVNPQGDSVDGWGFSRDTAVTVEIADGTVPVFTGVAAVDATETYFSVFPEVDIQPGQVVTVTGSDSGVVKTLEVVPLTFDSFDVVADVMGGTAAPDAEVRINGGDEFDGFEVYVTAGGSGSWTVDLSGEFDLTYDTWAEAAIDDDDGDSTFAWKPELPEIRANSQHDWVDGYGFGQDSTVSILIADGLTTLYDGSAPVTDGEFGVGGDFAFDLQPGHVVEVTGNQSGVVKTLIVAHLTFDLFDLTADVMAGTADPGTEVQVGYGNEFEGYDTIVTADTSGNWYLDVSGVFDLDFDTGADAAVFDDDGDHTIAGPLPPPQIRANPQHDWVGGFGFGQDSTVSILVTVGETTLYDGSAPVADGEFDVNAGFDLQPGHAVTVTGETSGIVRELSVAALTFDVFDVDTNTMSGTATEGTTVIVYGGNDSGNFDATVTATSTGWTLNPAPFTITLDTWAVAVVEDNDGDATIAWRPDSA